MILVIYRGIPRVGNDGYIMDRWFCSERKDKEEAWRKSCEF